MGDELVKFCEDADAVKKWYKENQISKLLGPRPPKKTKWINDMPGVLLSIKNFLPEEVAESASKMLEEVPDNCWNLLSGDTDTTNLDGINCAHRFHATIGDTGVEEVNKLFELLSGVLPPVAGRHSCFHLGKYEEGDHVDVQDDAAYALALNDEGEAVKCSRAIAVMLFLTKDWTKENGGCFKDCQQTEEKPEDTHVPEFNTLLAFHVPRLYQITRLVTKGMSRKCVFGWFLQEGELYDLEHATEQPSIAALKAKKKKKSKAKAAASSDRASVPKELLLLAKQRQEARKAGKYELADKLRGKIRDAGYECFGEKVMPKKADKGVEDGGGQAAEKEGGQTGGDKAGGIGEGKKEGKRAREEGGEQEASGEAAGKKKPKREKKKKSVAEMAAVPEDEKRNRGQEKLLKMMRKKGWIKDEPVAPEQGADRENSLAGGGEEGTKKRKKKKSKSEGEAAAGVDDAAADDQPKGKKRKQGDAGAGAVKAGGGEKQGSQRGGGGATAAKNKDGSKPNKAK